MPITVINNFVVFIISAIAILLGGMVFFYNPKEKVNQYFLGITMSMLAWVNLSYMARLVFQNNLDLAINLLRIAWLTTPLLLVFLYLFIENIVKYKQKIITFIIILTGLSAIILSGITNLVIKDIKIVADSLTIVYGHGMWFFLGAATLNILATFYIIVKSYPSLSNKIKSKINYFFIGICFFYLANITFNIILPVFWGVSRFYWIGDYSSIILLGFTGYAILKKELFDLRILLTSVIVSAISLVLAIDLFLFTPDLWLKTFKGFSLILFLIFANYLVRNISREIGQKKKIEHLNKITVEAEKKVRRAYGKLEKADKAKSEFISIASHQLRTPLTAIKGYISMISEGSYGELPEKIKEKMKGVYASNERLIRLVNDLLSISRLEAGRLKVDKKLESINDLLEDLIDEIKPIADQRNLYINLNKGDLPKVNIDADKMRQVFINLIDNSLKYTIRGGIEITTSSEDGNFIVKISDTGEGMSPEEIQKLFQSFSRGTAGSQLSTEGAGLGLYIARKFTEMHQGKIWAESKGKGQGSTFYIKVPL
jgi:signal transduction histidine kinase